MERLFVFAGCYESCKLLNVRPTTKFTPFRNVVIKNCTMMEKLFEVAGYCERCKLLNVSIYIEVEEHEGKKLKEVEASIFLLTSFLRSYPPFLQNKKKSPSSSKSRGVHLSAPKGIDAKSASIP